MLQSKLYALTLDGIIQCCIQEYGKDILIYKMSNEREYVKLIPLFRCKNIYEESPLTIGNILNRECCSRYTTYDFCDGKWNKYPTGDAYFEETGIRIEVNYKHHEFVKLDDKKVTFHYNGFCELSYGSQLEPDQEMTIIQPELESISLLRKGECVAKFEFGKDINITVRDNLSFEFVEKIIPVMHRPGEKHKGVIHTRFTDNFIVHKVLDEHNVVWSMVTDLPYEAPSTDFDTHPKSGKGVLYFYKGSDLFDGDIRLYNLIHTGSKTEIDSYRKSRKIEYDQIEYGIVIHSDSEISEENNTDQLKGIKLRHIEIVEPELDKTQFTIKKDRCVNYVGSIEFYSDYIGVYMSSSFAIYGTDKPFIGRIEYDYIEGGSESKKGFSYTEYGEFIVQEVTDSDGQKWSMVINEHIDGMDAKSIALYKGSDLFNGDYELYKRIINGDKIPDMIEFEYDTMTRIGSTKIKTTMEDFKVNG